MPRLFLTVRHAIQYERKAATHTRQSRPTRATTKLSTHDHRDSPEEITYISDIALSDFGGFLLPPDFCSFIQWHTAQME
jgi:hypothetical protein